MDPYTHDYPSPTGGHVVKTADNEVKMSHWIRSAVLVEGATPIFDFGGSWSADDVSWLDATHVRLALRHYPGDRSAVIAIDVVARTATCNDAPMTFDELARWLR